jgi:23S rRNA pseudouridine2605 synthase
VVRRKFEYFRYRVVKLDRVIFAGLNKKDIPRGKYRFLTENEIGFLKMKKKPGA